MSRRFAINLAAFFFGFFLIIAAGAVFANTQAQAVAACNSEATLACNAGGTQTCQVLFSDPYWGTSVLLSAGYSAGTWHAGSCGFQDYPFTNACTAGATSTVEEFVGFTTSPGPNAVVAGTPYLPPSTANVDGCVGTLAGVDRCYTYVGNTSQGFCTFDYTLTGAVGSGAQLGNNAPSTACPAGQQLGTVNGTSGCYPNGSTTSTFQPLASGSAPPATSVATPVSTSQPTTATPFDPAAAATTQVTATTATTTAVTSLSAAQATANTAQAAANAAAATAAANQLTALNTANAAATAAATARTAALAAANTTNTNLASVAALQTAANSAQAAANTAATTAAAAAATAANTQTAAVNAAATAASTAAAAQLAATQANTAAVQALANGTGTPTPPTSFCADNPTAAECVPFSAPSGGSLPSTAATWYTSKYPGGITGIWDSHAAALFASPLGTAIANMAVPVGSGSEPSWTFTFWRTPGSYTIALPAGLWAVLKAIVLLSAAFACRAIIFGG